MQRISQVQELEQADTPHNAKNAGKNFLRNKRGVAINQLAGLVLTLGIVILITTVMGILTNDLRSGITQNTSGWNASVKGEEAYNNIAGKFPLLGTIAILSSVILIVIGAFSFRRGAGGI